MNLKEFCQKYGISEAQFYGNEKIEGNIDLRSLTTIPEGCNLTAGGYIDLESLTTIPEGCNLTAGGNIYLRSLTTMPEGCNLTSGGNIYLRSLTIKGDYKPKTNLIFFQGGAYLKSDGIFAKVVRKFGKAYKLKKINSEKEFWMVTDGAFIHAHGETIKEAKEAFRFKVQAEKIKKEPITLESIIKIQHYRIITGACEFGVRRWIESNIPKNREEVVSNGIKVKDLLPILEKTNAYGLSKFKSLIK